jgi:hypothetical protein
MGFTDHIQNQITHHELASDNTLHVVTMISNSARYHSRYRLFREFQERMAKTANVKLYVVEVAFGDRKHEVTEPNNKQHLQLRTNQELWHKENAINVGVKHLLPANWKYVAWVDADVTFLNDNWAQETLHALQHHDLIQPWSECLDTGPYGNGTQMFKSFSSLVSKGVRQQAYKSEPYPYGHSGFAWACTREFWENTSGLMEFPILGSSDHHMAWAAIGQVEKSVHGGMTESFKRRAADWQRNAYRVTNGHLGYVPGTIVHSFHGPKGRRYYRERWQILVDNKFDPDTDLRKDSQGLIQVVNKPHLLEDISRYFASRHEDSIEEA